MNLAVFSESPIDEAVVRILIDGILGRTTSPVELFTFRARGWPSILSNIGPVLRHLHYRTVAESLVVVADSNNHEVHAAQHQHAPHESCRHCWLEREAANTIRNLPKVQPWQPVHVAVAVPCPSIEAWLLIREDRSCTEAGWVQRRAEEANSVQEIRRLKQQLYGTEAPHAVEGMMAIACERAKSLLPHLDQLGRAFPNSFGNLAANIRGW